MSQELIYLCYHNHPESRFSIFFWATFRPEWNQVPMFSTVFISMWKQHPKAFTCSNCFVSLKYIHPMFEFHDVAKKSRFFEFQTFSSRLLLTFCGELCAVTAITLASVLLLGRNGKRWRRERNGAGRTHASHQESAKPLQGFCCFQQHITSRNKSPWRYLSMKTKLFGRYLNKLQVFLWIHVVL